MRRGSILSLVFIALALALFAGYRSWTHAGDAHALAVVAGDNNCSGQTDIADAAGALAAFGGLPGGPCTELAGDLDCSGESDLRDVVRLLRYLGGVAMPESAGCPAVGEPYEAPPTSHELIEMALTAGDITLGDSLLYHLYVDLGDSRLPDVYEGESREPIESAIFHQIATVWSQLSGAEKATLEPYLLPPTNSESWLAQRTSSLRGPQGTGGFQFVEGDLVRVHWKTERPGDAGKAAAILSAMETKIWPDLVHYMGIEHAPLSDIEYPDNGGDGKFDIYVVQIPPDNPDQPPVLGFVSPRADAGGNIACEQTPAFMHMNADTPLSAEFLSTVAHEFMHAIQFTYDVGSCEDYRWMFEATAEWAEHFVYPRVNAEHPFAPGFLEDLQTPLERWIYKDPHQYGAYLLWFFLEEQYGMQDAVADTWDQSTNPDSLEAIESVLVGRGGFQNVWPEFALYNWNREPYEDYTQWDKLPASAKWKDTDVDVQGVSKSYAIPTDLKHVTQDHYHYTILDSVHSLTFINPFAGSGETSASVQALMLRNGQWTRPALDWTDEGRVSFCLDKPEEDVDELVIIISNSEHEDRNKQFDVGPAELVASPFGCEGWSGTIHALQTWFDVEYTFNAEVLFQHVEGEDIDNDRYISYSLVDGGPWKWEVHGDWPWGGCRGDAVRTMPPPGSNDPGAMVGSIIVDKQEGTYQLAVSGGDYGETFTLFCFDHTEEFNWLAFPIATTGEQAPPFDVDPNGTRHAIGEYSDASCPGPYCGFYDWTLTELKKD